MADVEKPITAEEAAKLEIKNDETISKKYDRQIRLWGIEGQNRLHNVHICVLGAGPIASETLKNLVLPGIGKFSMVDGEKVSHRDLGNNFFVELSGLGKPRVEEVSRLLHELNSFVDRGNVVDQDPVTAVSSNPDFVRDYDIIIATNLPENTIKNLGEQCLRWKKKLVVITTNGMVGMVRLYVGEHRVLESKPEGERWDLRIQKPWPALLEYANSFDLDAMKADLQQFSPDFTHVPFTVLLIKMVNAWRADHGGSLPSNDQEKKEFQQSIVTLGGGLSIADNFREAVKYKYLSYVPYEIPDDVQTIFSDPKCNESNAETPRFWLLARAVKLFVENEGEGYLPLSGVLPDMTCKPGAYVAKQKIYREKAEADCNAVHAHLKTLLTQVGKSPDDIPHSQVAHFCKHANVMKVFRFTSIPDEHNPAKIQKENIPTYEECGLWYLALRASGRFQTEHGREPGSRHDDPAADFENLRKFGVALIAELELDPEEVVLDDYLKELCRFGGSQIHNTCAFIGGVASQEVIKLITKQWHPVDNTIIYSGISGATSFFAV